MGRTLYKGDAALQVARDDIPCPTFARGDTIVGHVRRRLPLVSTSATIKVTLCGRTKSKITIGRGQSGNSYYRGRFAVIDETAHLQTIFQGPLHIAAGEGARSWPFALDIPTHCAPRMLANSVAKEQSFLPLDAEAIATHPLPDSFNMYHSGFSSKREGFVEYFIKATMTYMFNSVHHHETAILPFRLASPSNAPPIIDFSLRQHRAFSIFSSFKLHLDTNTLGLTFTQKRQKLFGSSKVPRIGGRMEVDLPRVVQIGNPNPIPVRLRFVPDPKASSPNMCGVPAKISVMSLRLEIVARTVVRCDGTWSPHEADDTADVPLQLWPLQPRGPLYIPCTGEWPAVDVGREIGLRILSRNMIAIGDKRRTCELIPDFTTYNIKRSHHVLAELVAEAGGEMIHLKVGGWQLVVLPPARGVSGFHAPAPGQASASTQAGISTVQVPEVPPPPFDAGSESWIHPPAEADAPPAFAEVVNEDTIGNKGSGGRFPRQTREATAYLEMCLDEALEDEATSGLAETSERLDMSGERFKGIGDANEIRADKGACGKQKQAVARPRTRREIFLALTSTDHHCIQPFFATMEQIRRRRLERTQYRMLKTLWQHLDFHSPDTLDDAALNALGVVRGADLDVDNPIPLDFEPRYFGPCHGEIGGLEEELETRGPHWRPSKDKPEHLRDDEWIRNAGYTYAEMRRD
ncbi:hypothetical protein BT67DRAFT_431067 [Trichocladium antarcticum]|uniref:Uncharacterized protein n=1 Tax=Trichocladium antarcticum TaxID=1450529 RepID=A0AAN6ZI62_9PEZI|nr:hypothetical protein BT67DRAFT_431067 [Trichocladium antarcticum]